MKLFALLALLICTVSVFAGEQQTIDVWPGVAPGEKADAPPEQWGPAKPGAKPSKAAVPKRQSVELILWSSY